MASGALPPGFPPIEIEGLAYWDGGVVSNTPLDYVLDDRPRRDHLIFQVDLFSARGRLPRDLLDVMARQKEITYSSRTRMSTNAARELMDLRRSARRLLERLPRELRGCPEAQRLQALSSDVSVSIVHLIYRSKNYESHWTDYEFSRTSMEEHWQAGVNDARRTLRYPIWLDPPGSAVGVRTVDAADSVNHRGELSPVAWAGPASRLCSPARRRQRPMVVESA
jgi:NTE family protein